jgi:biopolymer transport protein ExbB/TolQ
MGLAARLVVFTLVGMGIWSLVAGVERFIALRKSNRASEQFARSASELVQEGDFEAVLSLTERHGVSPLAQLYRFGLQSYLDNIDDKILGPVELATRQLSRRLEDLSAQLKRGTGILATTGSTAPFVGLFGTVIGIITVFTQMAESGGGGFDTVSAGIAEALIVTGLGLVIAIGAVWIFNFLTQKFDVIELQLQHASSELIDHLETKGGHTR